MKIRPVGAELFHADGQTDMTKLIVVFRNLAKAPKKMLLVEINSEVQGGHTNSHTNSHTHILTHILTY
jgi:hypothetical protein